MARGIFRGTRFSKSSVKACLKDLEKEPPEGDIIPITGQAGYFRALEYFGKNSLDFVDCVLAGYAEVEKDTIFTFDNKLQKLIAKI